MYSVRVNGRDVWFDAKDFVKDVFLRNLFDLQQTEIMPKDHWSMTNEFDYRYLTDGNFKLFLQAVEHEWNDSVVLAGEVVAFMYGIYGMRIPAKAETEI